MDGYHFSVDVRVRFSETDAQKIANNAVYLNWFEVARVTYLALSRAATAGSSSRSRGAHDRGLRPLPPRRAASTTSYGSIRA